MTAAKKRSRPTSRGAALSKESQAILDMEDGIPFNSDAIDTAPSVDFVLRSVPKDIYMTGHMLNQTTLFSLHRDRFAGSFHVLGLMVL